MSLERLNSRDYSPSLYELREVAREVLEEELTAPKAILFMVSKCALDGDLADWYAFIEVGYKYVSDLDVVLKLLASKVCLAFEKDNFLGKREECAVKSVIFLREAGVIPPEGSSWPPKSLDPDPNPRYVVVGDIINR